MTVIEKTRKDIKAYVSSLNTPDNAIYQENELLILSCFAKAQEILEKNEKLAINYTYSSLKLNDKNDRLSELGNNLIKEIEIKIPFIQLPQDESLYMALHKLKQEIKDNV